jgi:hypothetical protein
VIDRRDFDLKWNQTLPNGNLLGIAGARVLGTELAVAKARDLFSDDGTLELTDPETRERLAELVNELVRHHRQYAVAA